MAIDRAVKAVKAAWESSPTLRALTSDGKLHYRQAPRPVPVPYADILHVSGPTEAHVLGNRWVSSETVQIACYSASAQGAADMATAVRDAYRGAVLVWATGIRPHDCRPEGASTSGRVEGDGENDRFYETVDLVVEYARG